MKKNNILIFAIAIMAAALAGISCSGDAFHTYEVNRGDYSVPYVPDNTPPTVMSAEALSKNTVKVVFDEEVDEATAVEYTNYYIQGSHRVNVLADPAPVLGDDRKSVILTISTGPQFGMRHGEEYALLVQRVKDVDGNAILNSVAKFIGRGAVVAEVWQGESKLPETSPYPSFNVSTLAFDVKISGVSTGSYAYSLDGGNYSNEFDVSEKLVLPSLADGYHTLKVVGKNGDTGEWQDLNYATTIQFVVDTVPPTSKLSRVPDSVTTSRDIAVMVEGSGVETYSYRINSDALVENIPVSKAIVKENLPDGEYTLYVWGKDAAGNKQPNPTTYSWVICNNKPVAVLSNKPDRYTRLGSATIIVSGTDVYYYRYQINGGAWSGYESVENNIELKNLTDGDYTIRVIGAMRNGDSSSEGPAVSYTWTVDNVAPVCTISNLPANPTNSQKTFIVVSSESPDIAGYRYRLYMNGSPQALSGKYLIEDPIQLTSLPEGSYTIKVMGVDFAGNQQSEETAAEWSWVVDTQAPKATLSNLPEPNTNINSIDVGVGPQNDAVAYKYLLSGATWSGEIPIKMSINKVNLPDETYTLSVVVRDLAGNWQSLQNPTRHVWTIDTTPPVVVLYDTPASMTNVQTANISVGGVGVVKYQYRLKKSGVWEDWTIEYDRYAQPVIQLGNIDPLPEGSYEIQVRGFDLAGNRQDPPTSYSWTISFSLPTAVLENTPKPFTNVDSISITVSNVDNYKYKIDGDAWSGPLPVSTLIEKSSLQEGPHTLLVIGESGGYWQSIDNATTCTWTVDKTPPVAELTNRPQNPTSDQSIAVRVGGVGVYSYKYALALSPENPDPSGNTEFKIIDNPVIEKSSLGKGTYVLKVIARDEAGNWQAVENATTCIWEVNVDEPTAVFIPATLPQNPTKETSINISVGGTNVVSYKYKLDSAGIWSAETPISTPIGRVGLNQGSHTVYAIGKSSSGIWQGENTPTTHTWVIDTTPPSASDIILSNLPNDPTSDTSLNVTVGGTGITHYKYKINSGDWSADIPVSSPITDSGLTDNTYTLYVIARDEVGNWTPADQAKTHTWRVDTILPIAAITNRPDNPTNVNSASFIIGGTGIIEYKYNFDGSGWTGWDVIANPITLPSLADGSHTILVCGRKSEALVQADSDATSYTWVVDTQPPTVTLTVNEPTEDPTTKTSVNITVGGAGVVAYKYRLDSGDWVPASSEIVVDYPITLGSLEPKQHTIYVKGRDLAGNWSSEVSHTWTIQPPELVSPKTYDAGNVTTSNRIMFSWLRPVGTADVKIQIATDSNFTNIVFGGPNGVVIGNTDFYDFLVESSEIEEYYARVSVNDVSGRPADDSSWRAWGQASDGIKMVGGIIGKVRNIFGDNVNGASIYLKRIDDGSKVAESVTDANGDFALVNVPIGGNKYRIEVTASGYQGGGKSPVSVDLGAFTNVGLLYLVPTSASPGTISGKTVSANTGFVVPNSTVTVYNYLGQQVGEGTSDVRGFFTVKKQPGNNPFDAGVYRVVFSKGAYFNLEVNNVVVNGNVNIGRQAICEELFEPQVRFIYQWFEYPSDPDIYLTGPTAKTVTIEPTNRFIIWSDLKNYNEATGNQWGGITDNGDWYGTQTTASLVMDAVTGYGPEAINMYRYGGAQYAWGIYTFSVHRFAYNPYWKSGNRGKSAVFDLTATLTSGSNIITGNVGGTDKVFSNRCTVTNGSDEIIVTGTTGDGDFYSYYNYTVTGSGIPANSYLTWYDRSTTTNRKFTINNLATANGNNVTITFSRNIESYGIYPGTIVKGTGIPADTYVRKVTNTGGKNFEIELSNNATASGSQTLTFYPGWGRTSGQVRIYSSLGVYRDPTFPADKLGSDNNVWKVFKLNINGYDREKWKFYEINAVDFIDDDFSSTNSLKPKMDW